MCIQKLIWSFFIYISISVTECGSPWQEWWMYEGVSGPHYWGKINSRWILCSKGKHQSPINIEPKTLLFDPGLKHIKLTGSQINGTLLNKGNDVTFELHKTSSVMISMGPLSYAYRLHQIKLHFGESDNWGSEHSVAGKYFAAEIQLMFYNSDVYANFTQAVNLSRGIVILSIFVKVKEKDTHEELLKLTSSIPYVRYKGDRTHLSDINIFNLIPDSRHYMTYDGSLSQPGCQETVTWIIINRPIIIDRQQINAFRTLRQDMPENPQALMYNNVRPVQLLNQRTVRTNINFVDKACSMQKDMEYKEAEEPTIRVMASKRKTVSLVIYGQTEEQILHELAEDFRDQLLQSENITQIELEGVRPLEINIEISQDNLRRYNLSLSTIAQRIRSASLDLPGGSVKTASGEILIRMRERKDTGLDFAQIPIITTQSGATIILGDIATITDGYEDTDYSARYNGYPAIMLQVYRVGNQTPIAIADAVKQQIENSKTSLPTGIYADIRYDASEAYSQRMDLLLRNSALGLTMVFITLALFLEIRLAFWVMAGIPIAFLGPFLFLPALGVSLNMISMFAFIIALGIVVDDAIIIGENVYHYRQEGYPPLTAAIRGAQEMATPITFSILTNIATFMPLFFMPGVMGKIFFMIPTVVILVFLLSLVESLFILPNHLAHLNDKQRTGLQLWLYTRQQKFSHTFRHWVKYRYGGVLDLTLKHRYLTVIAALALLIATLSYASSGRMGMSMFPKTESDFAQIRLSLPFGTPVEKTQKIVDHLIKSARSSIVNVDNGEQLIRGIFSEVGNGGSHKAVIRTYLAKPEIRDSIMSTDEFSEQWRSSSGEIAGIESLIFESDSGGPGSGSAITIELTHRDISVLEQASLQLATALRAYPMAKDIANSMSLGKQQLDFTLLADGESLGLTPLSVARQVRNAFYGAEILRQQRGRNEIKVMLRLPEDERVSMQDMYNFLVWTDKGVAIPLNEIVQVKQGHAFTEIKRRNGRRNVQITANVTPRSQSVEIVNDLKDQALPALVEQYPGLQFSFQGRQADMADSIGSLKLSFIFAVLGIYTMLAIPFKSYILPLIVIVSIPFGIIGAIFGHIIMGFNLSILSMLGIVALSGIVVNDSLVLISQAVHLEKETDLAPKEIIRAASIQRFRPIILTTLTTFFGLAPIILETSRQARMLIPMAVSIGFGIVFATLITLVLIPSLYLVIDDCKNFCKSKFS